MNKIVFQTVAVVALLTGGLSVAQANQVSFVQSNVNALPGQTLTFDLVGSGFTQQPDAAAFTLSWNPSVLQYVNTSIANPPWDPTSILNASSAASGTIDYVFLTKSAGTAGTNFSLASFTFNVIGNAGAFTNLNLADSYFGGFVAPGGQALTADYIHSEVKVVPLPGAVWLFGTALLGLGNGRLVRRGRAREL